MHILVFPCGFVKGCQPDRASLFLLKKVSRLDVCPSAFLPVNVNVKSDEEHRTGNRTIKLPVCTLVIAFPN